jgi:peptide/nickel transport system ATP-binding protein
MNPITQALDAGKVSSASEPPLLSVEDLHVHFATSRSLVRAVEGASWQVARGETVALVGESGCGKSVSALAIMRLLPRPAGRIVRGRVVFDGRDLLSLREQEMRALRGRTISMIFQEPMTSFNPVLSVGLQITEPLRIHLSMDRGSARARAIELLKMVGISDAERRLAQYPHEFSGGMRQRLMIAISLACRPKLIIADEPTTALDVTIQAQILRLLKDLSRELGISMVLITHNLGIVARYADRVIVMYAARTAEQAGTRVLFSRPLHPYTAGLLRSLPRLDRPRGAKLDTIEGLPPDLRSPPPGCRFAPRCSARQDACERDLPELAEIEPEHFVACRRAAEFAQLASGAASLASSAPASRAIRVKDEPLLEVRGLKKYFDAKRGWLGGVRQFVHAVDDVSFAVRAGETLGLVGESGCGKSTVGRTLLRLVRETAGSIIYGGREITHASSEELRRYRRTVQVIFQDPYSSLNPRMSVGQIVSEPILVHGLASSRSAARRRAAELLAQVGLFEHMGERYPHELSGGQRQRVGIARALAMAPQFIVCDEPVSALDVSIQAQIINLLEELQGNLGLTYLFIAHDLAVVRHIADRVMVMYLGRVMEIADRDRLYGSPAHPYTRALLDAVPIPDPQRSSEFTVLGGEPPSALSPPRGCVFHTRCPLATEECRASVPPLREVAPSHYVACIKA